MTKGRLEAFSDGVLAIIITIMVLELKVPHEPSFAALRELLPIFLGYVLSFVYVGIYWNNHHHTFQAIHKVDGRVLWANLHLLFWLSLFPFASGWMSETNFAAWPVALYGVCLIMAAISYTILVRVLIAVHGNESAFAAAIGSDTKGMISLALYAVAIPLALLASPWLAFALYTVVAIIWFIPDKRMERAVSRSEQKHGSTH
jgi:uncharacterized membrane protein